MDYVFSEKQEMKELESLLEKLPFYELSKESFFVVVQPYYFVSQKLTEHFKRKGFVYFIQNESGLVKIGKSKNPVNRMAHVKLCCNNPILLDEIFVTDNVLTENQLHKYFKNKNVYGEWFKLNSQDIEIAQKLCMSQGGAL